MRGLTIIAADRASERFRCALSLAAAQAALGGRARIFCQGEAAALLQTGRQDPDDDAHVAAGLPRLAALLDEALALGVEVIACQSGLALTGIEACSLDKRIGFGGLVSLMQTLSEDQLLCV